MNAAAQVQPQAKPTRRQLAAQRRAERNAQAKQWLAGRKDSQTPVEDRLIASMGYQLNAVGVMNARAALRRMLINNEIGDWGNDWQATSRNAAELHLMFRRHGISTPSKRAQDAIDYLTERGHNVSELEAARCKRAVDY